MQNLFLVRQSIYKYNKEQIIHTLQQSFLFDKRAMTMSRSAFSSHIDKHSIRLCNCCCLILNYFSYYTMIRVTVSITMEEKNNFYQNKSEVHYPGLIDFFVTSQFCHFFFFLYFIKKTDNLYLIESSQQPFLPCFIIQTQII